MGRAVRGRDGRHQYKSLGESLEFDEAKRRGEIWVAQLAGSAVRRVKMVGSGSCSLNSCLVTRPKSTPSHTGRPALVSGDSEEAESGLKV